MFVPDRMKTNAFRILRLSAGATLSEIHKAAGSMRRALSLGVANATEADMPVLGEVSRSEADVRAAVGRLENPTQRLSDRLFWFHVPPGSRDAKASARHSERDGAALDHDAALQCLFASFEAGFDDVGVPVWIRALRAWHQVVSNDDYWARVVEVEQRGAFEPRPQQSSSQVADSTLPRMPGLPSFPRTIARYCTLGAGRVGFAKLRPLLFVCKF